MGKVARVMFIIASAVLGLTVGAYGVARAAPGVAVAELIRVLEAPGPSTSISKMETIEVTGTPDAPDASVSEATETAEATETSEIEASETPEPSESPEVENDERTNASGESGTEENLSSGYSQSPNGYGSDSTEQGESAGSGRSAPPQSEGSHEGFLPNLPGTRALAQLTRAS
jgi:hypothetical protein